MEIRKTTNNDLEAVMEIYAYARAYMRENGNPMQWGDVHPPQSAIEEDIRTGRSYVITDDDRIIAVFYFNVEEEPTYNKIEGAWLNNDPYGVVHRIAKAPRPTNEHVQNQRHTATQSMGGSSVGAIALNWCIAQHPNIRIDTHKDNTAMLRLMDKLGFTRCGTIWLDDLGDERIAFQKVVD